MILAGGVDDDSKSEARMEISQAAVEISEAVGASPGDRRRGHRGAAILAFVMLELAAAKRAPATN
jgi:hypothetical protein